MKRPLSPGDKRALAFGIIVAAILAGLSFCAMYQEYMQQ